MSATANTQASQDQTSWAAQANPFFTAETNDHEMMARWMLTQQEDESEAS